MSKSKFNSLEFEGIRNGATSFRVLGLKDRHILAQGRALFASPWVRREYEAGALKGRNRPQNEQLCRPFRASGPPCLETQGYAKNAPPWANMCRPFGPLIFFYLLTDRATRQLPKEGGKP